MKQLLLYIPILFLSFVQEKPVTVRHPAARTTSDFKLRFQTIGFGSNMFNLGETFVVHDSIFLYTMEEVWIMPDQKEIEPDTLLVGNFRMSSIDSISNLINPIKDSLIDRYPNGLVMSGSACSMVVSNSEKKIKFWLHNASDSTADKIVDILNTYIPEGKQKLHISDFEKVKKRAKDRAKKKIV